MSNNVRHLINTDEVATIVKEEPNSSGGGSGMEARIARLEANVEHIQSDITEIKSDTRDIKKDAKSDFKLIFGAIIFASLGLAGLMAKGFGWL